MVDDAELGGRHLAVTGGTGGLGGGVIEVLLARGAILHVPVFVEAELADFPWRDHERVHVQLPVDLSDDAAVEQYYAQLPPLWASIHLAGGFGMVDVAELTTGQLEEQLRINALTCALACRGAVRSMRAGGHGGRIVNVTARPALEPRQGAGMTPYVMAKAGVAALTQGLASEVLAEGILVNAVAPSVIDTPGNRAAMPDADHDTWVAPQDIGEVVAFLVSPRNRVVSGALVPVYGRA